MTQETISFDRPTLKRFQRAIKSAEEADQQEFTFEGHAFYTPYAKYLAEYVEGKLALHVNPPT